MESHGPIVDQPVPCPYCGYDLRAHPEGATCPECGQWVLAGQWRWEMSRWFDGRVLDLWCVSVIQITAIAMVLFSVVTFAFGQVWTAGLGAAGLAYALTALVWYVIILASFVKNVRRPGFWNYPKRHRKRLFAWLLADALLFLTPVAIGGLLWIII
ncbi:MAG: hypothetical protein J5J06_06670 [Phycisphaerae bacterium]|nr:hypothetical protein [Phycisphaerae bacterium]